MFSMRTRESADIAIDLGTSSTRIVERGSGLILEVPTILALSNKQSGEAVHCVGEEAKAILDAPPPGIRLVRPIRQGVVEDFPMVERLLKTLLEQVTKRRLRRPRLLICVPAHASQAHRLAIKGILRTSGRGEIRVVSTTISAAIGAELPIQEPKGNILLDVGGGQATLGVLSLGGLVLRKSISAAGEAMDEAIIRYIKRKDQILIGESQAEHLKEMLATALPSSRIRRMRVSGQHIGQQGKARCEISTLDVHEALKDIINKITGMVSEALQELSPDLCADIIDRGMLLCGGTSQLSGLDHVLREASGIPVLHAENASHCVANGVATLLQDRELFARVVTRY